MQQSWPAADYEIVVVNNHPPETEAVRKLAATLLGAAYRWRVVEAPVPGLYHARNVGLATAQGEIVCFIDDDAIAHCDWLAQVARAYGEHPQTGVIGGHIILVLPEPPPYVSHGGRERYWSHFVTSYAGYTEVENYWELPWGANWSARRTVLIGAGGFPTEFDGFVELERRGLAFIGDDLLAASRIARQGYRVAILPQAVVYHHVEADRFTFGYIWRRILASTLFRYLAHHQLVVNQAAGYARAKLPILFNRQGPLPLFLWEIACHFWAHVYLLTLVLRRRWPRRI